MYNFSKHGKASHELNKCIQSSRLNINKSTANILTVHSRAYLWGKDKLMLNYSAYLPPYFVLQLATRIYSTVYLFFLSGHCEHRSSTQRRPWSPRILIPRKIILFGYYLCSCSLCLLCTYAKHLLIGKCSFLFRVQFSLVLCVKFSVHVR